MYPASVLVSFTVFAVGAVVLWRRGAKVRRARVGRALVRRERARGGGEGRDREAGALRDRRTGRRTTSRASTTRSRAGTRCAPSSSQGLLLYVWRRLGWVAAAWAAIVPVCLVAASWHVPSDVAGGVLFGLPRGARRLRRRRALRRPARLMEPDPADVAALLARRRGGRARRPAARAGLRRRAAGRAAGAASWRRRGGGRCSCSPRAAIRTASSRSTRRAVKALAADLYDEARRAQLARGDRRARARRARAAAHARRRRSSSPPTSTSPGGCFALALVAEELATRMLRPRDSEPAVPCRCVPEVRHCRSSDKGDLWHASGCSRSPSWSLRSRRRSRARLS